MSHKWMKKKEGIRVEKMGEPFRFGVIGCGIFAEANIFQVFQLIF